MTHYLRGNARISTILAVVLTGTLALAACGRNDTPTEVLGREVERTTTTQWVPPTTAARSEADVAYDTLMDEVPEWRANARSQVIEILDLVCSQLDDSNGDFATVGEAIVVGSQGTYDLSYGQAGSVLGAAIIISCPEWASAASDFANS